ncbi:MAG: cytochrome c biogenesis protein CcdA [Nitrospirae bacterium]|nr:cytochrome c biogenesis protein CcdA [Nitrospirota bacterium]
MDASSNVSFMVALTAGFLSFVSPCVLPLLPSYASFITGISFDDMTKGEDRARIRKTTTLHSLFFILGFSTVFVSLGASATTLGNVLNQHQGALQKAGGLIVMLLGLHFAGLIKFGFLQREKRIHLKNKPLGYAGSVLVGISFAAGWTPCIGPILGAILMVATTAQTMTHGMALLSAYSLGLGIPFFLSSLALNSFLSAFKKIAPYMNRITMVSGLFLIGVGLLIFTNNLGTLSQYVTHWFSE